MSTCQHFVVLHLLKRNLVVLIMVLFINAIFAYFVQYILIKSNPAT